MLAALLLAQTAARPAPFAEATALLKEMRAAKSVEVRHVDGETILATKLFHMVKAKPNGGADLLAAIQGDFLKAPNDRIPDCGFHADVAIVTKGKRTLKTEMCFGCGIVAVEVPGPPMRHIVQWSMNDHDAMKAAVHALYPGIRLGRGQ